MHDTITIPRTTFRFAWNDYYFGSDYELHAEIGINPKLGELSLRREAKRKSDRRALPPRANPPCNAIFQ